jgi:hypothetical protein
MWFKKRGDKKSFKGHLVRRGDERSFDEHVTGNE